MTRLGDKLLWPVTPSSTARNSSSSIRSLASALVGSISLNALRLAGLLRECRNGNGHRPSDAGTGRRSRRSQMALSQAVGFPGSSGVLPRLIASFRISDALGLFTPALFHPVRSSCLSACLLLLLACCATVWRPRSTRSLKSTSLTAADTLLQAVLVIGDSSKSYSGTV